VGALTVAISVVSSPEAVPRQMVYSVVGAPFGALQLSVTPPEALVVVRPVGAPGV
jgi:hypothetical protein